MPDYTTMKTWVDDEDDTTADRTTYLTNNIEHLHDWLGMIGAPTEATADSAGFTAETTLLTFSPTIPVGGRDIMLHAFLDIQSTVAGDVLTVRLKDGGATFMTRTIPIIKASSPQPIILDEWIDSPASGAKTYTLTVQRTSGTGTVTMKASATNKARLWAEAA